MIVKAKITLKGLKDSKECTVLADTGAAMTVVDKGLAEAIGVQYTGRTRSLTSATGQELKGEVAIVRELLVEDEPLDYEKILVVEFNGKVREALSALQVDDAAILGVTTMELANYMPDTSKGVLRKFKAFLF